MTNNFKMIINGKEIPLPFDMDKMFSQIVANSQTQIPQPQPSIPKQQPMVAQQQIIRKIVMCKDTEARNIIIELNQRIKKLEEMVNKKSRSKKVSEDKPIIKKDNITKKISKSKEIPKTKEISKNKSKVAGKKIGKKK